MDFTRDIALQDTANIALRPAEEWQSIPRDRFQIANDLWIGKIEAEEAERVFSATEPRGERNTNPYSQYTQLYSFVRELGNSQSTIWDEDKKLYTCIALSRIVHPTTASTAYAAKLFFSHGSLREIIPGPVKGHSSVSYITDENARDWLTVENLVELKNLHSKMQWFALPFRVQRALFKYDHAAGDIWVDMSWPKLCAALDGLIQIPSDYETPERQFVTRGVRLAEQLNISASSRDLEQILSTRSGVSIGEQLTQPRGELLRLQNLLSDIVRSTIKRAILDPDFAAIFKEDSILRSRLSPSRQYKGIIKAVRGARDLLPPETEVWNFIEITARDVFRLHGFQEIRTPVFEDTQLFARGVGEETDIVAKEMFTWEDRARAQSERSQSLTLRPENTAGVVRAYIEHSLGKTGQLQRFYYIGPQFRRERPQKGRYRQFYQIGAEVIGPSFAGSESPSVDAEMIVLLQTLLNRLGIEGWNLEINSVGCSNDRPVYLQVLRDALKNVVTDMCPDCQRRAQTNPLRVLDCKVPEDQPIIERLPKMSEYLDDSCRTHFEEVKNILIELQIPFNVNERLVRGLDYYTRTAFEFKHGALGAQNAIVGGGRYDGLSEALGGPAAPGIGFAIGEDRLVMTLMSQAEK